MMKQILKAGPNQMETLRRLRTEGSGDRQGRYERFSYPLLVSGKTDGTEIRSITAFGSITPG
jgi:hypothetical protein